MKYILVFLTLIGTLTKAEFDEICDHPTENLESLVEAKCENLKPVELSEQRTDFKSSFRSLNPEKPAVVHLVSLQRLFLNSSLLYSSRNPQIFHQKLHTYI